MVLTIAFHGLLRHIRGGHQVAHTLSVESRPIQLVERWIYTLVSLIPKVLQTLDSQPAT